MKISKFISFFLLLLLPICVQAGPDTLLNKLRGVWYSNVSTLVFNFENNQYFVIIGATFYIVPIANIEPIANVLLFETTGGKKSSMRLINSDIAIWTSENVDEPYIMFRWTKGNISRKFINGAWITSKGTVVYDFDNNKCTFIYGTNKEIFNLDEIQEFANVIFYQEVETKTVYCIRYISDDIISLYTNKFTSYATLFRWREK